MASFEQNVNESGERYRKGEIGVGGLIASVTGDALNGLFNIDRARSRFYENRQNYDNTPEVEKSYPRHLLAQAGVLGESLGAPLEGLFDSAGAVANAVDAPVRGALERANPAVGAATIGRDAFKDYLANNPEAAALVKDIADASNILAMRGVGGRIGGEDKSMRGFNESSADVIVDNFYNPRQVEYPAPVENLLQKISPDKKSESGKEVFTGDNTRQNKIRKVLGFGSWAAKGLSRVAQNLVDPFARATYSEFGISPAYTAAYRKFKQTEQAYKEGKASKADYNQALDAAHSQMQQMANIRHQANAEARIKEGTDPFMLAATDPNSPMYFRPSERGDNWYHETANKGANLKELSPEESKTVQDHVMGAWGIKKDDDVKIVVKKPTGMGGNHFKDVVAQNKYFKHALHVFDVGQSKRGGKIEFDSVDDLYEALENRSEVLIKEAGKKDKVKAFRVVKTDDTGVWITGSRAGSAKVEGGINMLMKIEPNGNITGYMSDLHDFLDKVPVVKDILNYTLPTKVLAVSTPMQSNIFSIMSKESAEKKFKNTPDVVDKRVPYPSAEGEATMKVLGPRLDEAASVRPTARGVARQIVPIAENATVGGLLTGPEDETDYQ
jgi:hypothetical protein